MNTKLIASLALLLFIIVGCKDAGSAKSVKVTGAPQAGPQESAAAKVSAEGPLFFESEEEGSFRVTLEKGADDTSFTLGLEPRGSNKVNKDYPISFTLDAGGEKLKKSAFELSDKKATLPLAQRSLATVSGVFKFSVCDTVKNTCDLKSVHVDVSSLAPTEAPATPPTETTL